MPYSDDTAGFDDMTEREKVHAVFGFGGLTDLSDVLSPLPVDNGKRRAPYPPLLHYGVAVAARIFGSQRRALHRLRKDGLWMEAIECYVHATGIEQPLPLVPPTEDQQNYWLTALAQNPEQMRALDEGFTRSAVGQAKHLGNFLEADPDFANPDPRNTVFGDGTFYEPFSRVTQIEDPVTGTTHVLGSRATKGQPRLQRFLTDPTLDGKTTLGVNHVTIQTRTPFGWVVLANGQALGAEVNTARHLIDRLHDCLGPQRLHTVVWDRAISGWHLDDLMAKQRILTVTKAFARAHKTIAEKEDTPAPTNPTLSTREEEALRRYKANEPLPLGISIYRRGDTHEIQRSKYYRYGPPVNVPCSHDLWVDDGALFDVRENTNKERVKVALATPLSAVPRRPGDDWHLDITWNLPCGHDSHVFTTTWHARQGRRPAPRQEGQRALRELSVIARADTRRFHQVHGQRNHTESYNSWAKAHIGNGVHRGRAGRLAIEAQFLEHLCVGTLANAITEWHADQTI